MVNELQQALIQNTPNDVLITALQKIYRESLLATAKELLSYPDVNEEEHQEVIDLLESDAKRKLLVCPRGTFKSSLGVVAYSIWILLRNPNTRVLIDSEIYGNSKTFLREIKMHLESESMTTIFGQFKGDLWNEGEIVIKQRTRNFKEASITVSGIGVQKTGMHYDVIIHDDMNSPTNSNNPENCAKVIEHFKFNQAILEPDGEMLVIGTRYSANDLIGHILGSHDTDHKGNIF